MHKYLIVDQWGHPGTFLFKEVESKSMLEAVNFLNRNDLYLSDIHKMPEYIKFIHGKDTNKPEICVLIIKIN